MFLAVLEARTHSRASVPMDLQMDIYLRTSSCLTGRDFLTTRTSEALPLLSGTTDEQVLLGALVLLLGVGTAMVGARR